MAGRHAAPAQASPAVRPVAAPSVPVVAAPAVVAAPVPVVAAPAAVAAAAPAAVVAAPSRVAARAERAVERRAEHERADERRAAVRADRSAARLERAARAARPATARSTYVDRAVSPVPALGRPPLPASRAIVETRAARHERRAISAKRLALILAPALALTSGLALTGPASAAELPGAGHSVTVHGQSFRVSKSIEVPVIDNGTTTIVSYPAVVVSGGATVADAQTTIGAALSAGGQRAQIIQTALTYLGDTYVEGGASHSGIDCSGLVMVAYASVGIPLAHYVPTQDAVATQITEAEAQPGDLVVYDSEAHIGIYLGNGLVLQAPHPGEPVDIIPMFSAAHHFARILPAS